jgi:hypothetical protein
MSPIPLGYFATAGGGLSYAPSFEHIATVSGASTSTISFSSIPSTYKHLQVRFTGRTTRATSGVQMYIRANSDTGGNYSSHVLRRNGTSSVIASYNLTSYMDSNVELIPGTDETANIVAAGVIDIVDYKETTKFKTFKMSAGLGTKYTSSLFQNVLMGGNWRSTAAISSLEFTMYASANWSSLSTFSLYGIKGE